MIKDILSSFTDKNFRKNYKNYILQSVLIFLCISVILLLYGFFDGIIIASLGASSFILFVTPHTNSSRSRYLIGGYICGSVSGVILNFLRYKISSIDFAGMGIIIILISAAAVAVTTFLMIIMNFEHPPAAALALGLSVDPSCILTAVAALLGVIILCAIRFILKKYLKNLI